MELGGARLPMEMPMLGRRAPLYRDLTCLGLCILIPLLKVATSYLVDSGPWQ